MAIEELLGKLAQLVLFPLARALFQLLVLLFLFVRDELVILANQVHVQGHRRSKSRLLTSVKCVCTLRKHVEAETCSAFRRRTLLVLASLSLLMVENDKA